MHIGEIGHDVFSTEKGGVEDKLLRNWRRNDGQKVYGPKFTKWHAQDPSGLYSEVVENADNYACKSLLYYMKIMVALLTTLCIFADFVTMNFMQKNLGYYISDPQIQISPQDYEDLATENVTTESRNDGDDRCRWV